MRWERWERWKEREGIRVLGDDEGVSEGEVLDLKRNALGLEAGWFAAKGSMEGLDSRFIFYMYGGEEKSA